ncbi:efflux RND transporter periplasmic adaptor subunit [Enterovirga rhinocerotis]|uniref:efflux RND transporter periplasmic adaptor subunit n=1 Tax=Enterovirga rhinocerotis TaxID=1339210 RepID=UPI001AADC500|nr:efflux RND transporter periplasmic adaptor subunit [Enterovirga rhinocerotis]
MLCAIALALGATAWLLGAPKPSQATTPVAQAPAPPVTVIRLEVEPVVIEAMLPGRVSPFQSAEIRPQVSGVLQERLYREGQEVKAGQELFQIDSAPYRAALGTAEAALARAQASLEAAKARASRYSQLVGRNVISALDHETAMANQHQAEADVASARAALDAARIDLARTRIVSPIDGRASRSMLTVGALVTANQPTALLTVTQLDPVLVDLTQPADTMLRLRRDLQEGRLRRTGGDAAQVRLVFGDGTEYPHPGRLQFSEVTVASDTGSVTLRATFPNPDGILMPGLFVRARIEVGVADQALLVPQQAVTRNPRGEATALMVDEQGVVRQRVIRTRQTIGNKWLVDEGLSPGDRVVVEGVQRVRDGVKPEVREISAREFDRRGPSVLGRVEAPAAGRGI